MTRYDDSSIGQMVPVSAEVSQALQRYVPHLAETEQVRLISNLRATVVSVQDEIVVKYGFNVRRTEADTMQFVSRKTSVPIPKMYGTFTNESGATFIVMEFVRGESLQRIWSALSEVEKKNLAAQLKLHLDDMRKLKGEYIGALDGLPCMVETLQGPWKGPFKTENELNATLIQDYERAVPGYFGSMLRNMLKDGHEVVFSHSDLNMRNIVVRDKQIVSILDWECAGFFPEYWEYAHACLGVRWNDEVFSDYALFIQACLQPYPSEAATIALIAYNINVNSMR